jgi:hypothetical protein
VLRKIPGRPSSQCTPRVDVLRALERLIPGGVASPVGGGPRAARDPLDGLHRHAALAADRGDLLEGLAVALVLLMKTL